MSSRIFPPLAFLAVALFPLQGHAGDAQIVDATAKRNGSDWTISVTLRHADTGWDHYANLWQVLSPDGHVLGERVLLHPHVDEQPFTRSLSGIEIPPDLRDVVIRASDTVHGFSPETFDLALPVSGE